tara:strand:+ start:133 stop:495 length:363 start_codon:yes stop_codon:yes gene_type:complete
MKKDSNYIAAVEKAIAEKYGKHTVQDFRSTWGSEKENDYLAQLNDTPKVNPPGKKKTPQSTRSCPICKTYSFSRRDDLYMNRFQCCFECHIDFVSHREETWLSGSRPTHEQIELALRRRK